MKKVLYIFCLLACFAASSARAESECVEEDAAAAVCETACESAPCCYNVTVRADLLYWRTFQDDICSCHSSDLGKRWHWGYRAGLEYDFCSCWSVEAYWTHFQALPKHHQENNFCKIHYDTLDVLVGNEFGLSECFFLKPAIGLRYAHIKQHVRRHEVSEQVCSLGNSLVTFDADQTENFRGCGPECNVEGAWNIGCGFSLYASGGASILYGRFETKENQSETFQDPDEVCTCQDHCKKLVCLGVVDAELGIKMDKCFCDRYFLSLKLAWEHHRYLRFNKALDNGDLSFDGVSLSARLSF